MNNILDNPLVLKYFGRDDNGSGSSVEGVRIRYLWTAYRVLLAMQEPIRKGERFLVWQGLREPYEMTADRDITTPHQINLRLPSRFQETEKKGREPMPGICGHGELVRNPQSGNWYCYKCLVTFLPQPAPSQTCNDPKAHGCGLPPKPSGEVEEKIKELAIDFCHIVWNNRNDTKATVLIEAHLRELVAMARKEKTQP